MNEMSRILCEVAGKHGCQVEDLLGRSMVGEIRLARREAYQRLMAELGYTVARLTRVFHRAHATIDETLGKTARARRRAGFHA